VSREGASRAGRCSSAFPSHFFSALDAPVPQDHDDGSNAFLDEGNVVAFAGVKNYLGFNKTARGNLFVAPDFAGPTPITRAASTAPPAAGPPLPFAYYFPYCARSLGQHAWGSALADTYANNTCLLVSPNSSAYLFGQCDPAQPASGGATPAASGNTLYAVGAQYGFECGGKRLSLAEAQAGGYDVGTVVRDSSALSPAAIAGMIRAWLNF
jgi:hypothetical protein